MKLQTRKARYALTSQRIITKVSNRIRTLDLCNLPPITVSQKADGTGDIRFGETVSSQRNASGLYFGSTRSYSTGAVLELQSIPDVNRVEYRIRTAVEQALAARRSN